MSFDIHQAMVGTGNIFLIGPMGAGKTTIGKLLGKALGLAFWDSDKVIERRTGVTIPMIFEYEGEEGFRRREADVLSHLTRLSGIVLATGGGSILLPENRRLLGSRGFVVYLRCSVDKQLERTHKDTNRPLLSSHQPRQSLQELHHVREPLYLELADFAVDTGILSSRAAVNRIVHAFREKEPVSNAS